MAPEGGRDRPEGLAHVGDLEPGQPGRHPPLDQHGDGAGAGRVVHQVVAVDGGARDTAEHGARDDLA